jgi:uncharacterized membrane protein YhiD involved in acid resistance
MFELFPDGPVHEYPQLVNVVYSFLWAFLLSSVIAITHKMTFTGVHYPKNFFQALILGAIVTTMVMMAIGDSLARGLGVFGAMAIIRFRTRIDDPKDVLFLFAALSTGLAIGVYGFTASFSGTVLFCLVAFLLHFSPFRNFIQQHKLSFSLDDPEKLKEVLNILEKSCHAHKQLSVQIREKGEKGTRYQYGLALKEENTEVLMNELKSVEGVSQIKIEIPESVNIQ